MSLYIILHGFAILSGCPTDVSGQKYLSDSQTISQVLVKEGDVVNAGDTLMTYDTSMIELDLETQQLQLAQTKLKIQQSEKELEKLKKTKPVSDTPLNPVEPDFPDFPDEPIDPDFPDEPIPTPEPEPTYEDVKTLAFCYGEMSEPESPLWRHVLPMRCWSRAFRF